MKIYAPLGYIFVGKDFLDSTSRKDLEFGMEVLIDDIVQIENMSDQEIISALESNGFEVEDD
jgi:hypothetical protein